jgi:hypothetical protein
MDFIIDDYVFCCRLCTCLKLLDSEEDCMDKKWWAKVLRVIGIILMGLTAVFTIMGGIGTTCVALNPTGYDGKFAGIAPYQWLYVLFVIVTFAFGVMGARATWLLIRNKHNAYRYSIIALLGGTIVGVIHVLVSRALRGGSMPVDMVTYMNTLTLVVFLLFRIPPLWKEIGFGQLASSSTTGMAGGMVSITAGAIALTIQYWMGPTHTFAGVNYADVWHVQLQLIGWLLIVIGVVALAWATGQFSSREVSTEVTPVLK